MQSKLNKHDWVSQFADMAKAIEGRKAFCYDWNGFTFAVWEDGDIFPLTEDSRKAMNWEIDFYVKRPDQRILSDYCLSHAESYWRYAVGGIAD